MTNRPAVAVYQGEDAVAGAIPALSTNPTAGATGDLTMTKPTYNQLCRATITQSTRIFQLKSLLAEMLDTLGDESNRATFPDDAQHRVLWRVVDRYKDRFEEMRH